MVFTVTPQLEQPNMLAVQKTRVDTDECTLNILPCKINHTGSTKVTKRFWRPSTEQGTYDVYQTITTEGNNADYLRWIKN